MINIGGVGLLRLSSSSPCLPSRRGWVNVQRYSFASTKASQHQSNAATMEWLKRRSTDKTRSAVVLDLDEALYIAKEAGIATRQEIQKQIMTSPSFSPDRSPFVIENVFANEEMQDSDQLPPLPLGAAKQLHPKVQHEKRKRKLQIRNEKTPNENNHDKTGSDKVNAAKNNDPSVLLKEATVLTRTVASLMGEQSIETFWYAGQEYRVESQGKGTNRSATAFVTLRKGTGRIIFLSKQNYIQRFRHYYYRFDILRPFHLTNTCGVFDIFARIQGGGQSGQSIALRLAIGRALSHANPNTTKVLQHELVLYEDTRPHWPSLPMRRRSRAAFKFRKRSRGDP